MKLAHIFLCGTGRYLSQETPHVNFPLSVPFTESVAIVLPKSLMNLAMCSAAPNTEIRKVHSVALKFM